MPTDEMTKLKVRDRLRRTELKAKGRLPGVFEVKLTDEGIEQLLDAFTMENLKVTAET